MLFFLLLIVLRRWTASTVSYAFVLFPFVAILLSAWWEGTPGSPVSVSRTDPRLSRAGGAG